MHGSPLILVALVRTALRLSSFEGTPHSICPQGPGFPPPEGREGAIGGVAIAGGAGVANVGLGHTGEVQGRHSLMADFACGADRNSYSLRLHKSLLSAISGSAAPRTRG